MSRLIRYRPSYELWDARSPFDSLFDEARLLMRGFPSPWWDEASFAGDNLAIDLSETDRDIVVQAALPGVSEDEIEVEERQGYLTIRASSQHEDEGERYGWRVRERRYSAWQRTVQLPEAVRGDKARAELRDGILTVTLPKLQPAQKLVNRIKVGLPKMKLPKLGKKAIKVAHE
jgi:HSP20 family protein